MESVFLKFYWEQISAPFKEQQMERAFPFFLKLSYEYNLSLISIASRWIKKFVLVDYYSGNYISRALNTVIHFKIKRSEKFG